MPRFTFEKIKVLSKGRYKILQLEIDGVKQLDEFSKEIKGTQYEDEYNTLLTWMDYYVQTGEIGQNRLKDVTKSKKDPIKEFEFKSTNLRLYALQGETGKIIVLCGYKKNQKKDENALAQLKKQIFPNKNK